MSEQIKIDCTWSHLVAGFRRAPCLKGAISERDTVTEITFSTPDGETIVIPEGSKVELTVEQIADMYAIGIEHSPNEFGMTNGPHFDVGLMLEVPPPDSRAVILCFSKDGSERKTHKVDASGTEWEAIAFDADDFIEE
jgi:hypothetical protein